MQRIVTDDTTLPDGERLRTTPTPILIEYGP